MLTIEVNRPVFKPKEKWTRKEQMETIQKKKEEYKNKLKFRKRKNVLIGNLLQLDEGMTLLLLDAHYLKIEIREEQDFFLIRKL